MVVAAARPQKQAGQRMALGGDAWGVAPDRLAVHALLALDALAVVESSRLSH